jgi:hypothetical protein
MENWTDYAMKLFLTVYPRQAYSPEYLGAQRYGIILLEDFVVRPGFNGDTRYHIHLRRGQSLNLPTDECGFSSSSRRCIQSSTAVEIDARILHSITLSEAAHTTKTLRMDVEPD